MGSSGGGAGDHSENKPRESTPPEERKPMEAEHKRGLGSALLDAAQAAIDRGGAVAQRAEKALQAVNENTPEQLNRKAKELLSSNNIAQYNSLRSVNPDWNPDLTRANLYEAKLSGADLSLANLTGADLSGANLYEADLSLANLTGADLYEANLPEANLSSAILTGADLTKAILTGANLRAANLTGANLREVHLYEANLSLANLSRAKNLQPEQLSGALFIGATIDPELLEATLGILKKSIKNPQ